MKKTTDTARAISPDCRQFIAERGPGHQSSIGIILGTEKDDLEVDHAVRIKTKPICVAVYELQSKLPSERKGKLPTAKQLADVVRGKMGGGHE